MGPGIHIDLTLFSTVLFFGVKAASPCDSTDD